MQRQAHYRRLSRQRVCPKQSCTLARGAAQRLLTASGLEGFLSPGNGFEMLSEGQDVSDQRPVLGIRRASNGLFGLVVKGDDGEALLVSDGLNGAALRPDGRRGHAVVSCA